jgi:hypothetical protein
MNMTLNSPRSVDAASNSEIVPYSDRELTNDIDRVRRAWKTYTHDRRRDGVYRFLKSIFELLVAWQAQNRADSRVRRALYHSGCQVPKPFELVAALITVAAHPKTIDRRTVAKWSRVLRYAAEFKNPSKSLKRFIVGRGGVNGCAALFTRRLGRKSRCKSALLASSIE